MLRFTIRDVLWLMVVVGMGAGWFVHIRAERAARRREDKVSGDLELAGRSCIAASGDVRVAVEHGRGCITRDRPIAHGDEHVALLARLEHRNNALVIQRP